jgi:hypothetical protein
VPQQNLSGTQIAAGIEQVSLKWVPEVIVSVAKSEKLCLPVRPQVAELRAIGDLHVPKIRRSGKSKDTRHMDGLPVDLTCLQLPAVNVRLIPTIHPLTSSTISKAPPVEPTLPRIHSRRSLGRSSSITDAFTQ